MIDNSAELIIVAVAIGLTLLGLICQMAGRMLVSSEVKRVARLNGQWPQTATTEWKNDPTAVLRRCGIGTDTLTGRHVLLASKSLGAINPPSASDLLAVTEDSIRSRVSHTFPNALLSILLILGLAGTIYILRDVLQGEQFQRIIDKDAQLNTEQLQGAVKQIYGGFGHAFIFSLCGITGTIVLVLSRALFVRPRELRFFSNLQRLTIENLQPTFQREEISLPEALERAARSSENTSERFAECVKQLSGTLESAAGATAELGENVGKLSGFASVMGKAGKALERATVALEASFSEGGRLTRVFDGQERSNRLLTEAVQSAASGLSGHSGRLGDVQQWLEKVGGLVEAQIKAAHEDRGRQSAALETLQPLKTTTESVSSKLTELTTALEPLTKGSDLIPSQLREIAAKLASVNKAVAEGNSDLANSQANLRREMEVLSQKISASQALSRQLKETLRPPEAGIDEAPGPRSQKTRAAHVMPQAATGRDAAGHSGTVAGNREIQGRVVGGGQALKQGPNLSEPGQTLGWRRLIPRRWRSASSK